MTKWIKVKAEELKLLLEVADEMLGQKIFSADFNVRTACHYLRKNQEKLKALEAKEAKPCA